MNREETVKKIDELEKESDRLCEKSSDYYDLSGNAARAAMDIDDQIKELKKSIGLKPEEL